jgi:methionyl aminopeptidase
MTISSRGDLEGMQRVGRLVAEAHAWLATRVVPGMTTALLDDLGARFLKARGARSAPQFTYGFPGFNLISVNDEIVHGIPGPRALQPGDVVKLDITAELDGFIADAARTIVLPGAPPVAKSLARCARQAFKSAMHVIAPGAPVRLIGRSIERTARKAGFSVLRELTGHGVGRTIHEKPTVPNFDDPRERATLQEGMVIAVEPLLSSSPAGVVEDRDGWTLRTSNGALAVHHENTIVVQNGAPVVLTSLAA